MMTALPTPRRWRAHLALFLLVALGYVAWRAPGELIWDDSPVVCENEYSKEVGPRDTLDDPQFLGSVWANEFGRVGDDGYRPLARTVRRLGLACHAVTPGAATAGFLALNAVVFGLLAISFYRLARRFTRTPAAALLAVFLLLASTPVLTGSLVLFAGIQALVPLTMCAALNCYFAAAEGGRPWLWLPLMGLLLLVGPWYREFVGLTPLLVLFAEVQRGRWLSGAVILGLLGFAHALFPTALLRLLVFPELPVAPVFQLGALAAQVRYGLDPGAPLVTRLGELVWSLHWRVFADLVSILPPTLFLLAAAGWAWTALRRRAPAVPRRQALFLGFFFLLTFLPFLKVFNEHVHLAYCLVPASVLLAASAEALWDATAGRKGGRLAVAGLLLVVVGDHALNPVIVRGATRDCYAAIARVAAVCTREMPEDSILLCNAHHAWDLRYLCRARFTCYYTSLTAGAGDRVIDTSENLQALLHREDEADIFCLDVRLPQRKGQRGRGRVNWVVRNRPVALLDYGEIDRVSYRYPVVDPLKLLLPIQNTTWPGSPDLEFDYYRGPALDGTPGMREVAVSYHFYKIVGGQRVSAAADCRGAERSANKQGDDER